MSLYTILFKYSSLFIIYQCLFSFSISLSISYTFLFSTISLSSLPHRKIDILKLASFLLQQHWKNRNTQTHIHHTPVRSPYTHCPLSLLIPFYYSLSIFLYLRWGGRDIHVSLCLSCVRSALLCHPYGGDE